MHDAHSKAIPEPSHHLDAGDTTVQSVPESADSAADSAPAAGNAESTWQLTGHLLGATGPAGAHLLWLSSTNASGQDPQCATGQ